MLSLYPSQSVCGDAISWERLGGCTHLGPTLLVMSLYLSSYCDWISPGGYDCKTHLSNSHQRTLKKPKVYHLHALEGTQHAPGHNKGCFNRAQIGVNSRLPKVLWVHSW